MTELRQLSARALSAAYQTRSLSPLEVAQSVLAHMQALEPKLCATYLLRPELALAQAKESEARWRQGIPLSPIDGVPVTIKDNVATAGDPWPVGTAASDLSPQPADAPPAARLREAGTVTVAKTTMPDYGMLSSGLSSFHKLARNPWDLSKTPGGSSSGAGSAAAAGYGPLHVGTDIGGSVRLPCSWCGVFGLKPSLGRIPIDPPYFGRVAGPMTREVGDSALLMQVLSAPDTRDTMSLPPSAIDWAAWDVKPEWLKGKRIGLLLDAGCGLPVQAAVREAVQRAAQALEQAGAQVTVMKPFFTREMLDGLDHFWRMRSHVELSALPAARREKVLPFIRQWADSAARMSGPAVFVAQHQIYVTRVTTVRACAPFDYVISPTAPITAFNAELPSPTNDPLRPLEHIAFTVPFNMSEQPAASVNCGYSAEGLPIGLQIVGARFDDLGVLQAARAFEQIRAPQRPWPASLATLGQPTP